MILKTFKAIFIVEDVIQIWIISILDTTQFEEIEEVSKIV